MEERIKEVQAQESQTGAPKMNSAAAVSIAALVCCGSIMCLVLITVMRGRAKRRRDLTEGID